MVKQAVNLAQDAVISAWALPHLIKILGVMTTLMVAMGVHYLARIEKSQEKIIDQMSILVNEVYRNSQRIQANEAYIDSLRKSRD